ncbi:hypothetical protein SSS_06073 [Sarcoptes scabiei]|uniref:Uncharacterized protein n=1 Tax=Sarcoptes scabiei TaxID=52283 RepID=A0A132A3Q1_SARSC|nr:hypothetical protein SSS_06073 [Sarcoptes scabiei]KPM05581.1 hypothetical protein QR98_0040460 [Sarcoptes scabiei]UXI14581.1 hypothetical protein NH340_JMT00524 [Sarcoptes scabiei]
MRLTCFLSSFRREFIGPIPKHKGNVLRGKDRFVPPVTTKKKVAFFRRLAYEEEAMRYLSSPYISEIQENQYLQSIGRDHPSYWDDFTRRPIIDPIKQTYSMDFMMKLNVSRSFEEED